MVKWRKRKRWRCRWNSTQSNTDTLALAYKFTKGAKGKTGGDPNKLFSIKTCRCSPWRPWTSATNRQEVIQSADNNHNRVVLLRRDGEDLQLSDFKGKSTPFCLAGDTKPKRGGIEQKQLQELRELLVVWAITSLKKIQQCTKILSKKDALLPWCPREVMRQGRAVSLRLFFTCLLRCLSYLGKIRTGCSSDMDRSSAGLVQQTTVFAYQAES